MRRISTSDVEHDDASSGGPPSGRPPSGRLPSGRLASPSIPKQGIPGRGVASRGMEKRAVTLSFSPVIGQTLAQGQGGDTEMRPGTNRPASGANSFYSVSSYSTSERSLGDDGELGQDGGKVERVAFDSDDEELYEDGDQTPGARRAVSEGAVRPESSRRKAEVVISASDMISQTIMRERMEDSASRPGSGAHSMRGDASPMVDASPATSGGSDASPRGTTPALPVRRISRLRADGGNSVPSVPEDRILSDTPPSSVEMREHLERPPPPSVSPEIGSVAEEEVLSSHDERDEGEGDAEVGGEGAQPGMSAEASPEREEDGVAGGAAMSVGKADAAEALLEVEEGAADVAAKEQAAEGGAEPAETGEDEGVIEQGQDAAAVADLLAGEESNLGAGRAPTSELAESAAPAERQGQERGGAAVGAQVEETPPGDSSDAQDSGKGRASRVHSGDSRALEPAAPLEAESSMASGDESDGEERVTAPQPMHEVADQEDAVRVRVLPQLRLLFFFFCTLVTGPRSSLRLKLSDTRVYEP